MSPKRLVTRRFWVRHRGALGYLVIVAVIFYLYHAQQTTSDANHRLAVKAAHAADLGVKTHAGVCRLKQDLQRRVASSEAFLRDHPNGIPGISAKQIQVGIDGQKRTVKALRVIGPCPKP